MKLNIISAENKFKLVTYGELSHGKPFIWEGDYKSPFDSFGIHSVGIKINACIWYSLSEQNIRTSDTLQEHKVFELAFNSADFLPVMI
jgi:hypothetical protein